LNWDWRNIGGVNYVPTPLRQNCGSCYAFSAVSALESRLRIQTLNKDQTLFSRQHPLSCSFYTEGCEGGYPLLVGKFFYEFEILPEACFPLRKDGIINCSKRCDNSQHPKKYSVSKYGYLGGYYGATTEELMVKEIYAHGPIPGNLLPPPSFSMYASGVFQMNDSKGTKKNIGTISTSSIVDRNITWQNVQHSIVLVGWGEENNLKYWIGMNSWGTTFGEGGFFKILRGENDCNIESMGDYIRLKVEDRS